ncbi:hypothetical protein NEOLI_004475 [Neolecta irregularis DAH-3]|uniref:Xylanolytic transcriptional activator regulatory domain-containing protein n=1 Tax=Neolecta irregularis (strain DAH-3) TaxID=1198029 RepID=A0A1U7LMK8_NEOID|nr:hypothetical protein NEOLI_004475 [Neolecta irregularis DAH-3]|eukprot:OLL23879.1 hypothetical protein NEOLI_004475 [Neolecta irregularis DAH-3]
MPSPPLDIWDSWSTAEPFATVCPSDLFGPNYVPEGFDAKDEPYPGHSKRRATVPFIGALNIPAHPWILGFNTPPSLTPSPSEQTEFAPAETLPPKTFIDDQVRLYLQASLTTTQMSTCSHTELPACDVLQDCFADYWIHLHPHLPFLDESTYTVSSEHPGLTFAICAVGSLVNNPTSSQKLFECSRRLTLQFTQSLYSQLWTIQAMLLTILFELRSGAVDCAVTSLGSLYALADSIVDTNTIWAIYIVSKSLSLTIPGIEPYVTKPDLPLPDSALHMTSPALVLEACSDFALLVLSVSTSDPFTVSQAEKVAKEKGGLLSEDIVRNLQFARLGNVIDINIIQSYFLNQDFANFKIWMAAQEGLFEAMTISLSIVENSKYLGSLYNALCGIIIGEAIESSLQVTPTICDIVGRIFGVGSVWFNMLQKPWPFQQIVLEMLNARVCWSLQNQTEVYPQ